MTQLPTNFDRASADPCFVAELDACERLEAACLHQDADDVECFDADDLVVNGPHNSVIEKPARVVKSATIEGVALGSGGGAAAPISHHRYRPLLPKPVNSEPAAGRTRKRTLER